MQFAYFYAKIEKRISAGGVAVVEICKVEGECTVSKTTAIEWLFRRRFNNGETSSLDDKPMSGRPSTTNIEALSPRAGKATTTKKYSQIVE